MHALDDYSMTLSFWPDHAEAGAGRERLERLEQPPGGRQ